MADTKMAETTISKRFAVLSEITRAQHFAWREAVAELVPELDPRDVVLRMWELTGRDTAKAFVKRIDRKLPLAPQIGAQIVRSSACMGEDAELVVADDGDEALVHHDVCPWLRWHERNGLREECQPGCDRWFASTLDAINESTGAKLAFETLQSMPAGAERCTRRMWVQGESPDSDDSDDSAGSPESAK